ncbi:hypothetical protein XM53_18300 [Roseovarius atlanticus]|uniref:Histidine kinase/HSP90-like ATPase domain-containing protein n=1 Tax=Roseovarius atlanticus TaxID=1641875 RepID=A0A0T5NQ08_9RHOB|nr:hypothetical protein XM53_18300 [Roseovarius atlanticus]
MKRTQTYFDFSVIENLSPAVALVMTAEYHRAAEIIGSAPPAIELDKWSDAAFLPLFRLGFFEAIGQLEESELDLVDSDDVFYLRALSGKSGTDLERISKALLELIASLDGSRLSRDTRMALNSALGEAMVNVSKWAYPSDYEYAFPNLGKFWVTASVDGRNNLLTVSIYDQGISIPVSYPRQPLKEKAWEYLKSLLSSEGEFKFQDDSAYIDCAMRFGNSHSDLEYRGQGLPQMKELIDTVENGCLTICSRGGLWQYEHGRSTVRKSFPNSIGGTLIEWKLKLSEGETND